MLLSISFYAQDSYLIKGVVSSESDNSPLPGVSVIIVNTVKGTDTDFDGNYSLKVTKGDVLQFSSIGFKNKLITITGQSVADVSLEEDANVLDEVVVVGYGNQKEKTVTSAMVKVDGADLQKASVSRVEDALKGRVAGLRIQVTASEAGGDPKITLRGPGSITGSSSPLIVVDGVILGNDADILGSIDNNNIESVNVLKDAASVAIYGSRGANGVILVTLKKGVAGDTKFSYNAYTGIKYSTRNDNFNSTIAQERARLDGYESTVAGITDATNFLRINDDYNNAYAELEAMDFIASLGGGESNWQDEIFPGGTITSHAFSLRGGTELTNYSASLSYLKDEGIALVDQFEKYNIRLKIDGKTKNKKIRFGATVRASYNDQDRIPARFTDPLRQYGYLPTYLNAKHLDYVTAFDTTDLDLITDAGKQFQNLDVGSYGFSRAFDHVFTVDPNNPRDILRDANGTPINSGLTEGGLTLSTTKNVHPLVHFLERSRVKQRFGLNASSYIEFKLAKGLKFKQVISGVFRHTKNNDEDFLLGQENRDAESFRNERRDETNQYTVESTLRYDRTFGKHSLKPVVGFEYQNRSRYYQESEAFLFTNDFNENIALADGGTTFTLRAQDKLVSYFGRLNYGFDDKYLVTLVARADSSTRFGSNTRTGYFPSASVGWVMSNENFLSSSDFISFLKLRASYGVSGSDQIANSFYDSTYRFEETFATVGVDNQIGVKSTAIGNPDLGWESLIEFNPGIDITFGGGVLDLTVDYYTRTSEDLIISAPVAAVYGVDTFVQNLGEVKNEGVEIEASSRIVSNENFSWSASGQFSLNRNTVQSLGANEQIISRIDQDTRPTEFIARVGQPITSFYGWVYDREIPLEHIENPFNRFDNDFANVYVKDLNNDGIIDDEDRTELGSPYPDFEWGFSSDFNLHDFDFSFQWQGSHGAEVRVADLDQLLYSSESAVNPVSTFEEIDLTRHRRFTDDHIQDASFVALRNVTLGYTLPESISTKYKFDKLRLYLTGENLLFLTASDYQGFNPEAQGQTSNNANTPLTQGYQRGDGPVVRTVSAGINFQF